MRHLFSILLLSSIAIRFSYADGAADNLADKVRPVPPPGIEVPADERASLEQGLAELGKSLENIRASKNRNATNLWPDVQIYHNAVRYALQYGEIWSTNEIKAAHQLLQHGMDRAHALEAGEAPWTKQAGLIVRGYVSKIDGSVQPYGLVVPGSYTNDPGVAHRLDTWFHGRDEKLSELNFLAQRERSAGEFTPANAFVLHLYGRYCNANKMAGEIDLLEALDHVKANYNIDENRIVERGFSMGGAAAWHFAVHYADQWVAAAPGAGFSETPDFLKVFQNEKVEPADYERTLWHWYDCTDWAINLFNCPTVAYSGEIDSQKQAADVMAKACEEEGLKLTHIIGPKTPHRYEPGAKSEVNRRIDAIVQKGRNPVPTEVRFTTWTLRYNRMFWVQVDGLDQHWQRARVNARIVDSSHVEIDTENVNALTLEMPSGHCPLDLTKKPLIAIDGNEVSADAVETDRSWTTHLRKENGQWVMVPVEVKVNSESAPAKWREVLKGGAGKLIKRHGLQGPIDDAFMDGFLIVSPTGSAMNDKTGAWFKSEQQHAIDHWRKQFRGETRVVQDSAITDSEIAKNNLVLFGDPQSNAILAKIADKLPIKWTKDEIKVGDKSFPADSHVPVLIFPNPLNPDRYVVLNSGFTFREYDYLNNARQVAKLPDYAIVDISKPITSRAPGEIATAGFFNEHWELK
jgi:poly(3-hydroxybutyrate) depolymerase